jgi:hypothetical protein
MHETPVPDAIPFRTLRRAGAVEMVVVAVLILIGVASLFLAAADEPLRMWQGLLFNWLFWSSIALGMVILAVAFHLTSADWAWSIRRFATAGTAFLPVSFVLAIVLFFGSEYFFHHWLHPDPDDFVIAQKAAWLNLPFMIARDLIGLLILYGLAFAFAYYSLRIDVFGLSGARHRPLYDRMTRGWRGVQEEGIRSHYILNRIAPVLALAFALIWGMIAIDLAMTMEPHWFSTMFPVAYFVTSFHGGIAATAIAVTVLRKPLGLAPFITRRQYHDLGKMVFAFSVFWMYIQWSQYIVIWYGMLPVEQKWFVQRFGGIFSNLPVIAVLLAFVLPFAGLLTRPPKMVPAIVAFFSVSILLGHWIERFLLVVPTLWTPYDVPDKAHLLPLGLPEVGIALGFLGLFLASYTWFLSTFPVLPSPAFLKARDAAVVATPATATDP